ncbi:MAG: hypothetical protein HY516_03650 [Candidatus Aenigmarchaeota archaeon]|nr:hypothetical protein [Candidatus Aenigmarchaeota archaeon]
MADELPTSGKTLLIPDYTVFGEKTDPRISIRDQAVGYVEVDFNPLAGRYESQPITRLTASLLGASMDTLVGGDSIAYDSDGISALLWLHGKNHLFTCGYVFNLRNRSYDPGCGLLLGSNDEGQDRLAVPGIDCYVQPRIFRSDDITEWHAGRLLNRQNYMKKGLVHLPSRDMFKVKRFVAGPEPDYEWVMDEVRRFEENGENLDEHEVRDLYRELRDGMSVHFIEAREILISPVRD